MFHEAGRGLCSGVSAAQAARDLDVHENVLRKWVKEFGSDPAQAFPGHCRMKPEQQEIERKRCAAVTFLMMS